MSETTPLHDAGDGPHDFWVFAYGSLIWNPGFAHEAREPARLVGYHRRYCIRSMIYRGTPESPGLVLGLEAGGSCVGIGYRVAAERHESTMQYLRERELITAVYLERIVRIETRDGGVHDAYAYVADRDHDQYAPFDDFDRMVEIIASAHGASGPNAEYALATHAHLMGLGIRDPLLEQVADALRRRA